ncbi:hypothetical protein SLA2020_527630 [Shorea laevis]
MANELPEDLETEILLWLPVASLLRFKCVCKPWEAEIYVAGSCNGLVCLHDSGALCVVIWNPATNETKVVPKSYLPRNAPAGYRTTVESMGFGFDAKTNDYKIINVRSFRHPSIIQSENIFQTEVYSLSADSWRKVDGPPCFKYDRFEGPRKYINGMASCQPRGVDWEAVLSFDMSQRYLLQLVTYTETLVSVNG